jgi:hypothetical protein
LLILEGEDASNSILKLKFFNDGAESACHVSNLGLNCLVVPVNQHSPVASDLAEQLIPHRLDITGGQVAKVLVLVQLGPCHDRGDFAVEWQSIGKVEQPEQVARLKLLRVFDLWSFDEMAVRRTRCHHRMPGYLSF